MVGGGGMHADVKGKAIPTRICRFPVVTYASFTSPSTTWPTALLGQEFEGLDAVLQGIRQFWIAENLPFH